MKDKNAIRRALRPLSAEERKASEFKRIADSLLRGHDVNDRATYGQHPKTWGKR